MWADCELDPTNCSRSVFSDTIACNIFSTDQKVRIEKSVLFGFPEYSCRHILLLIVLKDDLPQSISSIDIIF